MVIDKVGNINNVIEPTKTKGTKKTTETTSIKDSVNISDAAKIAAEEARYMEIVNNTPEVRAEKVQQIKEQIQNGTYSKLLDEKVLSSVADKIADNFLK